MARVDWRAASAYEELRPLDAPAFAYEFLRRNSEFLTDHARLARKSRGRTLAPEEAEAFAQRWGLRFRPQIGSSATRSSSMDAQGAPDGGDADECFGRPRRS